MIAEKISKILQSRSPRGLGGQHFKPAAVLVPVQERADGDHLVLTQRAEGLNSHSGQVAFPGGAVDPQDLGLLETALRESHEEIGIDPRHVRVLGQLDQTTAAANYLVTPFVGLIPFPYEFRLNQAETAAVFAVPIAALLDPGCFSTETRQWVSGRSDLIYHFQYKQWDIWGATARIIKQFLELGYDYLPPERGP